MEIAVTRAAVERGLLISTRHGDPGGLWLFLYDGVSLSWRRNDFLYFVFLNIHDLLYATRQAISRKNPLTCHILVSVLEKNISFSFFKKPTQKKRTHFFLHTAPLFFYSGVFIFALFSLCPWTSRRNSHIDNNCFGAYEGKISSLL